AVLELVLALEVVADALVAAPPTPAASTVPPRTPPAIEPANTVVTIHFLAMFMSYHLLSVSCDPPRSRATYEGRARTSETAERPSRVGCDMTTPARPIYSRVCREARLRLKEGSAGLRVLDQFGVRL